MAMLKGIGSYAVTASRSGERKTQVVAAISNNTENLNTPSSRSGMGATSSGIYDRKVLENFVNYQDRSKIREIANDMYDFDPISGSAVDLLKSMPFSAFELSSLPDQSMLNVYAENLDALDIPTFGPEMSGSYMVDGEFVGTINEDKETNKLTGIIPYHLDVCLFKNIPFPNRDPLIDIIIPDNLKKLMRDRDPRMVNEFARYGDSIADMLNKRSIPLSPRTTIYFSRRTLATRDRGTSYFKRIIPIWIIEKALMRGTMDLAHRRQKSILHITAGSDEWTPSEDWLGQISDLFRKADADPLGAIVATRPEVQTNEVRSGSDFWRVDEAGDWFTQQKMRGLGISENLLSQDLTVDSTQTAITVFLETLRSFREYFTKKVIVNKILLLIAQNNQFYAKTDQAVTGDLKDLEYLKQTYPDMSEDFMKIYTESRLIDGSGRIVAADDDGQSHRLTDYTLPKIHFLKQLRPEGNSELVTTFGALSDKGLPIPLRMLAAAAGVSIHEIMRSLNDDIVLRKRIAEYKSKLPVDPTQAPTGIESNLNEMIANLTQREHVKRNRDFSNLGMRDPDTGKLLSLKGKRFKDERANKIMVEAFQRINSLHNARVRDGKPTQKKFHYSNDIIRPTNPLDIYGLLT